MFGAQTIGLSTLKMASFVDSEQEGMNQQLATNTYKSPIKCCALNVTCHHRLRALKIGFRICPIHFVGCA